MGGGTVVARAGRAADFVDIRAFDPERSPLNRRYIVLLKQEAARRYHAALSARLAADIRADGANGDQEDSGRLTWNLARAARRWERALIALDRPLPPGLAATLATLTPTA
jgi:hypothetical protein